MKRKVRVFLGAFLNYTNAQNLNCLALAKHLDKTKYEVLSMIGYSGTLKVEAIPGVRYLKIRYPARIWRLICFFRGIWWCDVAYLPKPENWRACAWMMRVFRRPGFKTVEGVLNPLNYAKSYSGMSHEELRRFFASAGKVYSITRAMQRFNEQEVGLKTEEKVLYLGVESGFFRNDEKRTRLSDVCFIGSDLFMKGFWDVLELAKRFPQLRFHVVGSGLGKGNPKEEVARRGLANVQCHGSIPHEELKELLRKVQLHVFPSRAEGFPKVILECAAAGVPSLLYADYGAEEWIEQGKNGFVVGTVDEMADVLADLLAHPEKMEPLAEQARELAGRFDWGALVKDWEEVLDALAQKGDRAR